MKLIIAGGRNLTNREVWLTVCAACVRLGFHGPQLGPNPDGTIKEVLSRGAPGVDRFGEDWATVQHIPYVQFKADQTNYGKAAGPMRNKNMAEYADALLLIWDGKSKGSLNMKTEMQKLNKPVYEVIV